MVAPTTKEPPIGTGGPIRAGTALSPQPRSCPEAPRPAGKERTNGAGGAAGAAIQPCSVHPARFIVPGPSPGSFCPVHTPQFTPAQLVLPWFICPWPVPLPSASPARLSIPGLFLPRRSLPSPSLPRSSLLGASLPSSCLPSSSSPVHLSLASVPCPVRPFPVRPFLVYPCPIHPCSVHP